MMIAALSRYHVYRFPDRAQAFAQRLAVRVREALGVDTVAGPERSGKSREWRVLRLDARPNGRVVLDFQLAYGAMGHHERYGRPATPRACARVVRGQVHGRALGVVLRGQGSATHRTRRAQCWESLARPVPFEPPTGTERPGSTPTSDSEQLKRRRWRSGV